MGRVRARIADAAGACSQNFRSRNLRRAQLAFGAMWAGEWAATVALGVVAFGDGGAAAIGLVGLLRMAPAALVAPFAATIADRARRDVVLAWVGLVRAATLGIAAAVIAADGPGGLVYAVLVVATVAQTMYRPAHSALLPALCQTPGELTSANVVRGLLDSLATLVGPLAAAGLIAIGGAEAALAACALASLVSALLVLRLRYEVPRRTRAASVGVSQAIEGLRALLASDPALRLITALGAVQTFLRGCVTVLVVVVAIDLLGGDDAEVGLLNAAIGLGAVAGSLIASMMTWNGRLARCFGIGVALWGAPMAALSGAPELAAALVLFGAIGVGNALVDVGAFTLMARLPPDRVMARVFATFEALLTLAVAVGAAVTAPAVALLGDRGALLVLGLVGPAGVA